MTLTYPIVGNYGVPGYQVDRYGLYTNFESEKIQVEALVVANYSEYYSHHQAVMSLGDWLKEGTSQRNLVSLTR